MTLLAVAVALSTVPPQAGDEGARFKEYFEKGEALYGQGEYGMAVHFFRMADARRATPEVAYDLAKCFEKLNDSAQVAYYYRLYLRRAPEAPDSAQVSARVARLLSRAGASGAGLLEVEAPRAVGLRIGERWFPDGPVAVFLPAGVHVVWGEFPSGRRGASAQVRRAQAATLSLEPLPPPLVAVEPPLSVQAAAAIASAVRPEPPRPASSALRVGGYGGLAAGVVAIATGIVLGSLSANQAARVQQDRSLTVSEASALASDASNKGMAANVLFGAGGAAAAAGAAMLVFSLPEPGGRRTGEVAR